MQTQHLWRHKMKKKGRFHFKQGKAIAKIAKLWTTDGALAKYVGYQFPGISWTTGNARLKLILTAKARK